LFIDDRETRQKFDATLGAAKAMQQEHNVKMLRMNCRMNWWGARRADDTVAFRSRRISDARLRNRNVLTPVLLIS